MDELVSRCMGYAVGTNTSMAKIKIGDVFEIETQKGKAYLQYAYLADNGIEVIRVLSGLYSEQPEKVEDVVSEKERYLIYFPLAPAYRRKLVSLVGHFPLPKDFVKPQYMRDIYTVRGEFLGWHIINTETLQRESVKKLSKAQKQLSPWGVWNDTLLKEKLEEGWSLKNWEISNTP